jgi:predicted DNA binding CopG/RHH family protein
MKRKVPRLRNDAAAEAFLDQDLSDLDFSQLRPTRFEFDGWSSPATGRRRNSTCGCRRRCWTR